jgi:hypothetical protein
MSRNLKPKGLVGHLWSGALNGNVFFRIEDLLFQPSFPRTRRARCADDCNGVDNIVVVGPRRV